MTLRRTASALLAAALPLPALAQTRSPFGVGIAEGGGSATGVTGWILAQQGWFEHQLSLAVRAIHLSAGAVWPLIGLSFVYGVFHAAGPGHGKAVLTSYMVANERAVRRGLALSLAAALLQGIVAVALVGVLAVGLHATAQRMRDAASFVETVSFLAIALLGATLVWRKGRVLVRLLMAGRAFHPAPQLAMMTSTGGAALTFDPRGGRGPVQSGSGRFTCSAGDDGLDPTCDHCAAIDPATLGAPRVSVADMASTVLAAGLRPCSGAILVLVFALAQGVFPAGVVAVLAMALGVAITTAALALMALFLKRTAARMTGTRRRGARLAGAAVELAAALVVLAVGVLFLAGATVGGGA